MKHKIKTLANGLTVLMVNDKKCPSITVMVIVKAGGRNENSQNTGIAHLIEHNLFKGTKKFPSSKLLSYAVENLGAYQNAYTGKEATSYYIKGPKQNAIPMIEILADMIKNPIFPQKEFEKEKKVVIEEIKMYEDHPSYKAYRLFLNNLFKANQIGQDIAGTIDTVSKISVEQCKEFISNNYIANNTLVIVSGSFKQIEILNVIKQNLKELKKGTILSPEKFSPNKLNGRVEKYNKEIEQTHIVIGGFAPGSDVEYNEIIPFRLGITIMSGGMGSKLTQKIREELGLAYYIDMGYQTYSEIGQFNISLGVDHKRVNEAINEVLVELKALKDGDITDDEFARAKNYILGMMSTSFETSSDIASWYGSLLASNQKIISGEEVIEIINNIKKEDVVNAWEPWLSKKNLIVVTYGKAKSKIVLKNI